MTFKSLSHYSHINKESHAWAFLESQERATCLQTYGVLRSLESVLEGGTLIINFSWLPGPGSPGCCEVGFSPSSPVSQCQRTEPVFEMACPSLLIFLRPLDCKPCESSGQLSFVLATPAFNTGLAQRRNFWTFIQKVDGQMNNWKKRRRERRGKGKRKREKTRPINSL